MSLQLYNTKTRSKEIFKTVDNSNTVSIYSCGPTVYDFAHIGNFSMYVFTDLLRRYLEISGYKVNHVMNITDVGHLKVDDDENYDFAAGEDKFEIASRKANLNPWEISKKYTQTFLDDMKKLNILNPEENGGKMPLATDNIREMQSIIKQLIDKGYAYVSDQENIYFDVSKFENYGKFSGKTLEDLEAGKGGRIDVEELLKDKKNIFDFSLWITDESHIMKWDFPSVIKSGKSGYPGWHIECSAMSMRYLSEVFNSEISDFSKFKTIDIHTGGEDHIFPHHEDEIAQSEGATGIEFCNFWLHRKHILINGEKMSKSKGNFFTISDLENGKLDNIKFNALDFRMWVLLGHYRSQRNFTLETMIEAKIIREKIEKIYNKSTKSDANIDIYKNEFYKALNDDLNTSKAISIVFEMANNLDNIDKDFLDEFNSIFAVIDTNKKELIIPQEIINLANKRLEAKKNKDFALSDEIRNQVENLGFIIKDDKDGYEIIAK